MSPLPRDRSFSLRTLMVLVGLACMLAAWIGWDLRVMRTRREASEIVHRNKGLLVVTQESKPPSRRRQLLGDLKYEPSEILLPMRTLPAELEIIRRAFSEARVIEIELFASP